MKTIALVALVGFFSTETQAVNLKQAFEYTDTWESQSRAGLFQNNDTETKAEREQRLLNEKIKAQIEARKAENERIRDADRARRIAEAEEDNARARAHMTNIINQTNAALGNARLD